MYLWKKPVETPRRGVSTEGGHKIKTLFPMARKKTIVASVIIFCVLMAGAGAFYFLKFRNKPAEIASSAILAEEARKNYFEINDELTGIYFKIGKNFDRMPASQLQTKNFSFIYGFYAKDDDSVACYISQTQREKLGAVKVSDLRDGVFEQVKKIYADAKLDSAEVTEVGENNNKGARLKMNYTDANVPKFQWEVAGITDKTATFAFCEFPQAVIDLYREDVNLFLDSLRIK